MTAKHRAHGQIPGEKPKHGIDGYGGKEFGERMVLRRGWNDFKTVHADVLIHFI